MVNIDQGLSRICPAKEIKFFIHLFKLFSVYLRTDLRVSISKVRMLSVCFFNVAFEKKVVRFIFNYFSSEIHV